MRIGLHSGSVAASVVGKKMPRWCLFGEDLTVVANCESNGEANKIHISERDQRCESTFIFTDCLNSPAEQFRSFSLVNQLIPLKVEHYF